MTYIQSSFGIESKQHYIVGYTNTMFTLYRGMGSSQTFKLAAQKGFAWLDAYQLAVQSSGVAVHMPVHQSSGCNTPPAGKLAAIFYLRIFAQRHRENAGESCRINKKNKCCYLRQ